MGNIRRNVSSSSYPVPTCEVGIVPHEDMQSHRKNCPLEIIQCEYHNVGCDIKIAHKDQKTHEIEGMREHLMKTKHVMLDELKSTKLQLTATIGMN